MIGREDVMRDDHFLERAQSAITGALALVPGIAECAIAYTIRAHHARLHPVDAAQARDDFAVDAWCAHL
jgi:hypothetical protein